MDRRTTSMSVILRLCTIFIFTALGLAGCKRATETVASESGPTDAPPGGLELLFTYGSEKEEWVSAVTDAFNRQKNKTSSGKQIFVRAVPEGSGESIDLLLNGASQAHLTSPASAAFIKLGNAQSRATTGKDLIGQTENLLRSPVVIAMWKPMAEAIGWGKKPVGWSNILALARSQQGWGGFGFGQWGQFKFGHTNPAYSNSGLISLFAEVYAATGKVANLTLDDVARPQVATFLDEI